MLLTLALLLSAAPQAHAYEVLELQSQEPRIAVIALAYQDSWTSYAGEWIFDKYLHHLMGRRYTRLYVTRGKHLDADDIRKAMTDALSTGMNVDYMSASHSGADSFLVGHGQWLRPDELLAPVITDANRAQLDFAANFGCYSEAQWDQFKGLGFRSYLGHEGVSVGAVAMRSYLKRWLRGCQNMMEAIDHTNAGLTYFFHHNAIAKFIFRKLSHEREYTAVMKGFGEDQGVCRDE